MKATDQESAALKHKFWVHFSVNGYEAPLPPDLQREADEFPNEWAEACMEWEND